MKKLTYYPPRVELFELKLEGVVCLSGGEEGALGDPGAVITPADIFELGGLL
ncbi:MAG: hypothetical protein J6M31_05665 [Bacteroidales bacterium]|nr:hypothetical protein [Bacteroidales bacterium]